MNVKAMTYESTSFTRIVADRLHCVRLVLDGAICPADSFEFTICHCTRLKAFRHE